MLGHPGRVMQLTPRGKPAHHTRAAGFSLVELAVVLAVFGILLGQGLPTISDYLENAAVRRTAVDLHHAAVLARSEAIKRNVRTELRVATNSWEVMDVTAQPQTRLLTGTLDPRARAEVTTVAFASNGRTFPVGTERLFEVTNDGAACAASPRCMAVRVTSGGAARVCSPQKVAGTAGACT
jgi:prepilin-type N-terminal cleavage/methylation domain-containing protein